MSRADQIIEDVCTRDRSTGCWIANFSVNNSGYSFVAFSGSSIGVHRLAYLVAYGVTDLPEIDHLCKVRTCYNPEHLRASSVIANRTENQNTKKTHCPKGHSYDDSANSYKDRHGRKCRICRREAEKERLWRLSQVKLYNDSIN